MSFKQLPAIEQAIAYRLIGDALGKGYSISVKDGEEVVLAQSRDLQKIIDAMASTEEDYLIFYDEDGERMGWVWLIYGNGVDLISDHTDRPDMHAVVAGAYSLSAVLGDEPS